MAKLEIGAEPAHSGMNLVKTKIMGNYVAQGAGEQTIRKQPTQFICKTTRTSRNVWVFS